MKLVTDPKGALSELSKLEDKFRNLQADREKSELEANTLKAEAYLRLEEHDQALHHVGQNLAVISMKTHLQPEESDQYLLQGRIYLSKLDRKEAAAAFEKAVLLKLKIFGPDHPQMELPYYYLAKSADSDLRAQTYLAKVSHIRREILHLKESELDAEISILLAKTMLAHPHRHQEARDKLAHAERILIESSPNRSILLSDIYKLLGDLDIAKQDYPGAATNYQRSIDSLGGSADSSLPRSVRLVYSHVGLAQCKFREGDPGAAEDILKEILTTYKPLLDPETNPRAVANECVLEVYYRLGLIQAKQESLDDAANTLFQGETYAAKNHLNGTSQAEALQEALKTVRVKLQAN
jgi:tetratricopeptide (TPR) repeat protein